MEGSLLLMCWEFFKAGLFALGGGVVSLPFFSAMAEKYTWFTAADVVDMIAISEATPGPFGVNMAVFAGFKAYGFAGAVLGVFSLVLPSFVIIILVSKFLDKFSENKLVKDSFKALRPCVCALVMNAWLSIANVALVDIPAYEASGNLVDLFPALPILLFVGIFLGSRYIKKLPPAFWIAFGAIFGFLFL